MISDYLIHSAVWGQATAVMDDYGEPQRVISTIVCRWEDRIKLVRNRQGAEVVSEARVFCSAAIKPGDLLTYGGKEREVIAVSSSTSIGGDETYYEVYV